uniref:Uncharacterized protein n=1 Tax=Molossus molossus TaxID=27622 RepID=A0A7J8E2R3_MOLMO|nr:hypothetical protein HJG59_009035 [Molossus molossus]
MGPMFSTFLLTPDSNEHVCGWRRLPVGDGNSQLVPVCLWPLGSTSTLCCLICEKGWEPFSYFSFAVCKLRALERVLQEAGFSFQVTRVLSVCVQASREPAAFPVLRGACRAQLLFQHLVALCLLPGLAAVAGWGAYA